MVELAKLSLFSKWSSNIEDINFSIIYNAANAMIAANTNENIDKKIIIDDKLVKTNKK
jgi:hypothetical protein